MSSSTSTEEQENTKPIMKTSKPTEKSESRSGKIYPIDFKEMLEQEDRKQGWKQGDQLRISKILADDQPPGQYGHLPLHVVYALPPPLLVQPAGKKSTVGKSFLSKLVSLPFLGGARQQSPGVYGRNLPQPFGEEQGRGFYL